MIEVVSDREISPSSASLGVRQGKTELRTGQALSHDKGYQAISPE